MRGVSGTGRTHPREWNLKQHQAAECRTARTDPLDRPMREMGTIRAIRRTLVLPLAIAALGACAGNGQLLYELGPDALWERAMEHYRAEEWDRAVTAFEQVISRFPTHPNWEEARWYIADSHFGNEDYLTAANEFDGYAREFGSSDRADDARFKVCESYYHVSPDVQLDQMYTEAALDHCLSLVGNYPSSEHVARAREIIDEMQEKLAHKLFVGGDFYFSRELYDSAILYFEDVLNRHPRTEIAPRALLRLLQIYVRLGYEDDARAARERLLADYPDSAAAGEAQSITVAGTS